MTRIVGLGFNCKASQDAIEPNPLKSKVKTDRKKKKTEEEERLRTASKIVSKSRIFEWWKGLLDAKATASGGGH